MTTATINTATNTDQKENVKNNVVCACCLTFFPVVYFLGSTIMSFVG
jgi:hypothetical protein